LIGFFESFNDSGLVGTSTSEGTDVIEMSSNARAVSASGIVVDDGTSPVVADVVGARPAAVVGGAPEGVGAPEDVGDVAAGATDDRAGTESAVGGSAVGRVHALAAITRHTARVPPTRSRPRCPERCMTFTTVAPNG